MDRPVKFKFLINLIQQFSKFKKIFDNFYKNNKFKIFFLEHNIYYIYLNLKIVIVKYYNTILYR